MLQAFLLLQLMVTPAEEHDAKELVHASMRDYDVGSFEKALVQAEDAYRLDPLPQILFNIGQCQRALKHWEQAVFFYRRYLERLPNAPNRAQVEDLLTDAQYRLDHPEATQPVPKAAPATPPTYPRVAPPAYIPSATLDAQPVIPELPSTTGSAPPEAVDRVVERTLQPPRTHATAYALGTVAVVGLAVVVVGIVEVESFESLLGPLQKPTSYATWQVQQANAVAQQPQAEAWQWAAWVSGAIAIGTGTAAAFTW